MWAKWVFDRVVALLGLVVLALPLAFVALLIRVKMGAPVIYKQKRVGQCSKLFTMYKFRSMSNNHGGRAFR